MRLHKEIDSLADKATITTEDDIHLILTFTNGTVVKITIPAIYPNVGELYGIDKQTFGMFKIDSVEGPQVPTLDVGSQIKVLWRCNCDCGLCVQCD